jgi:hypothetical protein
MPKHLSKRDTEAIVNLILGWGEKKLTWEAVCESAEKIIGRKPSRQSLFANKEIKEAFKARKADIGQRGNELPKPGNLIIAAERIKRLHNENEMLKKKNTELLEKFVIWQYNAYKHGVKDHELNEPLPRIDRERTE